MRKNYKPTNGWHYLGSSVYEHNNKTRIHTLGLIRFPNMTFIHENKYPEAISVSKMIAINGGNRKRGLMALAISMTKQNHELLAVRGR